MVSKVCLSILATLWSVVGSFPFVVQAAWLTTTTTSRTPLCIQQTPPDLVAFDPQIAYPSSSLSTTTSLSMSKGGTSDNNNNEEGATLWALANDFPLFLNQCAIQSFMFLLRSLRDPQTVLWLEAFTQPVIRSKRALIQQALEKNKPSPNADEVDDNVTTAAADKTLANPERQQVPMTSDSTPNSGVNAKSLLYHGLGLLNTTLFPTWDAYFRELLDQPSTTLLIESSRAHIPTYELQINPASLCSRILSVREQIAKEFANDLSVIASMGQQTLDTYWRAVKEEEKSGDAYNPNMKVLRTSLAFLDFTSGDAGDDENDYAPSPLRKGNFDLLVLLTTQEAIHRVLNSQARQEYSDNNKDDTPDRFLYNFYTERLVTHFTGIQPYGRADDFIEELMTTPPRLVQRSDTVTSLIDPVRIAELILQEREQVALEWKQVAQNSPQMHMEIKRLQLNRLMGRTGNEEANSYQ
jgi:hypothetical protein